MPTNTLEKGTGLQPLPQKELGARRDFDHAQVFGAAKLVDLPEEYLVGKPLTIKDQGYLDFCAAYASTEVSEFQEAVELNPHFAFMVAKYLQGPDAWRTWGIDLRAMCEAHVKVGCIEEGQFPFINDDRRFDRDFLADWRNWPLEEMKLLAADHKKESYWDADTGGYSRFDNLRSTMYVARLEERSILTGTLWRKSWSAAKDGVIPETGWENEKGEGHAIEILGWVKKTLTGVELPAPHAVVVNSWGTDVGDHGLFYFPASVIDKEFSFGSFTFRDLPKDKAIQHLDFGILATDGLLVKLWKTIAGIIASYFTH